MKLPAFSQDAAIDFLLRHFEKFVVLVVAVLAMGLAWGGIDAIRTQTVATDKRPDALAAHARRTLAHIDREKQPPDDVVPKNPSLTKLVEPWRAAEIAPPPPMPLLDSPLFDELERRTRPVVFPIEKLQATAGVAVVQPRNVAPVGVKPEPPKPEPPKPPAGRGRGRPPREEEPATDAPPQPDNPAADGTTPLPPAKIVPYVIVTGLIPVAKQTADYGQRFASTSHRDPKRDAPLWSDYVVERSTVDAAGKETWEKIDLKAVARKAREEFAGVQEDSLPPEFLLAPDQNPNSGTIGYCAALPKLATGGWGLEALHPFFLEELERLRTAREKKDEPQAEANAAAHPGETESHSPLAPPPAAAGPAEPAQPGMPQDAATKRLDYRLFRFVDLAVEPGKSYRYRVSLSVWNPNYKLPAQHLAEANLATEAKLPSEASNATTPVAVPAPVSVLVRTLPKTDMRRFKPGTVELLVLGPDDRSGNYALRSVITDLGGFVNVDRSLNKPGEVRARGEEISTGRLLVDVAGRPENREDLKTPKNAAPPEPLELIVMREDGGFELVTAAGSEDTVARYAATLPSDDPKPVEASPAGRPFTFPAPRQR